MNRSISDLLDDIQVDFIELNPAPAARSIRERTMNKIHKTARYRAAGARKAFGGIAIAALLFAMSTAAVAANIFGIGDYFKSVFGVMTESQLAVLEEIGKTDMPAVTSGGTTITPLAAIGDEDYYYLMLRIVAPEGTVLDFDTEESIMQSDALDTKALQFESPDDPENSLALEFDDKQYKRAGLQFTTTLLEDDAPNDNMCTVVLRCIAQYKSDLKFNDGVPKTLRIKGVWAQTPLKEYTKVLAGDWAFDVGSFGLSGSYKVNTDDMYIVAADGKTDMTLKYLYISPLGIQYDYTYDRPDDVDTDRYEPGIGPIRAVMKDGSTVEVYQNDGYYNEKGAGYHGYFHKPVNVNDIDHLRFWSYSVRVNDGLGEGEWFNADY
jgi:hypothetical protein